MSDLLDPGPAPFDVEVIAPVRHALAGHPLLQLESLRALASRLGPQQVRFHSGRLKPEDSFERAAKEHATELTLDGTLADLEHAGSWVYLQHIEHDPLYRALLDELLDGIEQRIPRRDGPLLERAAYVFLSSPGAVTPYHMDHEQNFLLQIAGEKIINVWDPRDRSVVAEEELDWFHARWSLEKTQYRPELQAKARVFRARAGDGVYMPFTAPHWVTNGDQVSVTLSCTFRTPSAQKRALAHRLNHSLRKIGLHPQPVGTSVAVDGVKVATLRAWQRAKSLVGRQ